MNRLFLLSPARCSGLPRPLFAEKNLTRLSGSGIPLGELFSFLSALYFRGKLAYAEAFARPADNSSGISVITPTAGLVPPETIIRSADLRRVGQAHIDLNNRRYCATLRQSAGALANGLANDCEVILLGSIASGKYLNLLAAIFGSRLRVPVDFIGRGDMSRGGLLLRAVRENRELAYIEVAALVESLNRRTARARPHLLHSQTSSEI